jgi:hypothetical protein
MGEEIAFRQDRSFPAASPERREADEFRRTDGTKTFQNDEDIRDDVAIRDVVSSAPTWMIPAFLICFTAKAEAWPQVCSRD